MQATVYLEDQDHIALCDLLKLAGLAESGGQAKALIAAGQVQRKPAKPPKSAQAKSSPSTATS